MDRPKSAPPGAAERVFVGKPVGVPPVAGTFAGQLLGMMPALELAGAALMRGALKALEARAKQGQEALLDLARAWAKSQAQGWGEHDADQAAALPPEKDQAAMGALLEVLPAAMQELAAQARGAGLQALLDAWVTLRDAAAEEADAGEG